MNVIEVLLILGATCLVQPLDGKSLHSSINTEHVQDKLGVPKSGNKERRAADGCGGTFTDAAGEITSPNFPSFYNIEETCDYIITVTADTFIMLEFKIFDTESFSDYIYLYDGDTGTSDTLIASYAGSTLPPVIFSSGPSMLLRFESDYATTSLGFYATFTSFGGTSYIDTCGGAATTDSGLITSPNYPNSYGNNQDCIYSIVASQGSTVQLEFLIFDTEDCCDYVELFDGSTAEDTSLGKFHGTSLPATIQSSGPNVYIHFYSNSATDQQGFAVLWTASSGNTDDNIFSVCSDYTTNAVGGTLYSHDSYPADYPTNSECNFYIRSSGSYDSIYLQFVDINLDTTDTDDCIESDRVIVTNAVGNVTGTVCKSEDLYSYDTTTGRFKISFTTNEHSGSYRGFRAIFALYYQTLSSCNNGSSDFQCTNNRCISNTLLCDDINHCGDNSDEQNCPVAGNNTPVIIGVVVGVVAFVTVAVVIIGVVLYFTKCKKSSQNATSGSTNSGRRGSKVYPEKVTGGNKPPSNSSINNEDTNNTG